jgi:putative transposase
MAQDDKLAKVEPLLSMVGNWRNFLSLASEDEMATFRRHERSGRPLGDETFVDHIELLLARTLRPQKPGPKQKAE